MNILVFSPLYPPSVGGLQNHAEQLNQHLSANGHTITVCTPQSLQNDKEINGKTTIPVVVIRFPAIELIPNYPIPKLHSPQFWRIWQSLEQERFDLVISRTRFFATSLLALLFAKLKHTPLLHIEHGSDYVKLDNPLTAVLARLIDHTMGRIVLRSAHYIVANSQATAKFVKKLSGKSATVIYRGVEHEQIKHSAPNTTLRQTFPEKYIITYLGRLIDGKGVQDLLRAIQLLDRPDIVCTIVGIGSYQQKLKYLSEELRIVDKIVFLGALPFPQAMGVLKVADIFVNPSYTEGLPTSVIEAALCRVPIVATHVGGTLEIIGNNISGMLIPPRNPHHIADAITKLLRDEQLRRRLVENAYRQVQEKFTWPASITRYEQLLNTIKK